MPSLRDLYVLDARIAYLEQVLAALGLIADPPPSDIARLGGVQAEVLRRPHGPGVVDPGPSDRVRLAELLLRRPHPGDPAASDRSRLAELLLRRPAHGDPAVTDRVRLEGTEVNPVVAAWISQLLAGVDPPPEDIARLTASEVEAATKAVSAEQVRLRSIEGLLKERSQQLGGGQAGAS